jgi:hypothetical protein
MEGGKDGATRDPQVANYGWVEERARVIVRLRRQRCGEVRRVEMTRVRDGERGMSIPECAGRFDAWK